MVLIHMISSGYGWLWNSDEYDTGGSLNELAAGWGGDSNGWNNVTFDLSAYSGQDVIVDLHLVLILHIAH